ncbi:MAG: DUF192 domain-containing protein [Candidatus Nanohaloarchaea archaeon]|nr:DUF192 domain-containing protein [Candidatus Nanohaloarchaea archaeon]
MRRGLAAVAAVVAGVAVLAGMLAGAETAVVGTPTGDITVAVADTPAERRDGLMHRSSVPHDGMLFVFDVAAPRTFWMKDTRIPLDIVFMASNGTVLNVAAADPEPGVAPAELARYRSDGPARYVLEVPQGDAADLGLAPGATVDIPASVRGR